MVCQRHGEEIICNTWIWNKTLTISEMQRTNYVYKKRPSSWELQNSRCQNSWSKMCRRFSLKALQDRATEVHALIRVELYRDAYLVAGMKILTSKTSTSVVWTIENRALITRAGRLGKKERSLSKKENWSAVKHWHAWSTRRDLNTIRTP